uniref:PLAT domain-containing protein n=1 Tax=Macrostomum lignano TaxID=282301 RepID=A0A1I8F6D2_9PLAT
MLEQHFPHVARRGVLMLNNGSFGTSPKSSSRSPTSSFRLRQVDLKLQQPGGHRQPPAGAAAAVRPAGECHHRSVQSFCAGCWPWSAPAPRCSSTPWTYIAVRMAATEAGEAAEAKLQLPLKVGRGRAAGGRAGAGQEAESFRIAVFGADPTGDFGNVAGGQAIKVGDPGDS